jgi:hypothetical protein
MSTKEQDFYVYTHSLEGYGIFYVGKGLLVRTKRVPRPHNPHHTRIVAKYGKENIIVHSMLCRSEQCALELEVKMIAALRNGGVKLSNITDGGEGASGHTLSDETKAKMSAAGKGKIMSDEHKVKISVAKKGIVVSDETKARLSAVHKGKVRIPFSEETRAKMSAAKKGVPKSDEHKAKMVLVWEKRRLSKQTVI